MKPDAKTKVIHQNEGGYVLMDGRADTKQGVGQSTPDPWAESSDQKFALGTLLRNGDRAWRYCKNGAVALVVGAPVQQAAAVHAEQDDDIAVGAAAAIGATSVEVTSTANLDGSPNNVANDFAEGYLIVNDEAGEGHIYKIKSNELLDTTADSTFTLYPDESIRVALTTSSQVGLVRNPFYKVIATTAVVSGMVVGVPQFAVTEDYYFWCQTGGPASVIPQAAIALGTYAVVGTTAAKANTSAAATTELYLGDPMTPGVADTEAMIVFLRYD
jgi:hypothetical protein